MSSYQRSKIGGCATATCTACSSTLPSKTPAHFFTSYAHDNQPLAGKLLRALDTHFKTSAKHGYRRWSDQAIPPGSAWDAEIQQAIAQYDFGLLLASPAFFASDYITGQELARYLGPDGALKEGKRIIPVALEPLDMRWMDLRGLQHRQIFFHQGKTFLECNASPSKRAAFVLALFAQIEQVCSRALRP